MKKDHESEDVINSTISDIASSLFIVLCDYYPELATTELEEIFNETFKSDVMVFIQDYRRSVHEGTEFRTTAQRITQAYTQQRFFEKLSSAIERSKKIRKHKSKNSIMKNQDKKH
ncbi:hypothetical protein [Rosenbergiella epipactidis]|uniref:hypothetical protein n=1 Tax=Rosenbergiella epipactidis TaxID=1544694 RepID=UPI001F4F4991|nr:hypothetical protein [Rosenbergiella epipactidis]